MPKTFVDGREVKKWFVDGRQVKKAYLDGRLIYQKEFVLYITGSNHNVTADWVWEHLHAMGGGTEVDIRIIVNSGVQLVTSDSSVRGVFNFYGGWSGRNIIIENYGHIVGRGSRGGGTWGYDAPQGGRAIYNESVNLTVFNHGIISGGGGGGGGSYRLAGGDTIGGGGGAPFGAGGQAEDGGGAASYTGAGGPGASKAGWGGGWAAAGAGATAGNYIGAGGAAGEATRGAINWIVLGDVRGARV